MILPHFHCYADFCSFFFFHFLFLVSRSVARQQPRSLMPRCAHTFLFIHLLCNIFSRLLSIVRIFSRFRFAFCCSNIATLPPLRFQLLECECMCAWSVCLRLSTFFRSSGSSNAKMDSNGKKWYRNVCECVCGMAYIKMPYRTLVPLLLFLL